MKNNQNIGIKAFALALAFIMVLSTMGLLAGISKATDPYRWSFGYSVSYAGDVNDDGYADIVVGAPLSTKEGSGELGPDGSIYVYHGSAEGLPLYPNPTSPDTVIYGNDQGIEPGGMFGYSVSDAGDVNNDGYDDIIVGAPRLIVPVSLDQKESLDQQNGLDQQDGGRAYVFYGGPTGIDPTPTMISPPEYLGFSHFGFSVSGAGDVNGDGIDDVIVGAPYAYVNQGRALVYLGTPNGISTTPHFITFGEAGQEYFGWSVSNAGDVDGWAPDDVIVGAPGGDRAYIWCGKIGQGMNLGATILGENPFDEFGTSVSNVGDLNEDGNDDVLIGAPHWEDIGEYNRGRAYIFYGKSDPVQCIDPEHVTIMTGEHDNDNFGMSVSYARDVGGGKFDYDIVIGAPNSAPNDSSVGKAYLYDYIIDYEVSKYKTYYSPNPDTTCDNFGQSVSYAAFWGSNYDCADIIVGAPDDCQSSPGETSGVAWVYYDGTDDKTLLDG